MFMLIRQRVQNAFLMGRQEGFCWFKPTIPALTIPYHDTNDFYFSGHVGACFMYMTEFFYNDLKVMGVIGILILINQWVLLWLVRTHYIIDLVSGLLFAHLAMITAERLSYYIDVKLMGWSKEKRKAYNWDVCHKCGWSNGRVSS